MIAAWYRPNRNRVSVCLWGRWRFRHLSLPLADAQALHSTLGAALDLAAFRDTPLDAVGGR